MILFKLILYLCLQTAVSCFFPALIGSHFISSESNYEVFLAGNKLDEDAKINVSLRAEECGRAITKVIDENSRVNSVKFKLDDHHCLSYELEAKYIDRESCTKQTVKLINMSRRPIILIQMDKPIYNDKDELKFRVFVLTQQLVPHRNFNDMNVLIYDQNKIIRSEFKNVKTSQFGVYKNSVKVFDEKNLGKWTIKVEVDKIESSKTFVVKKMDENTIQIDLIGDNEVALDYKKINLAINIKHPVHQVFFGKASVYFSKGRARKRHIESFNLTQQFKNFRFDIEDDLLIRSINSDVDLKFFVEVRDHKNTIVGTANKTMVLKRDDLKIVTSQKDFFVPGANFPVKIEVRRLNGQLDKSFNSLKVFINYVTDENSVSNEFLTDLEEGKKLILLTPSLKTREIKLKLKFENEELVQTIKSSNQKGVNNYIYSTLVNEKRSYLLGDKIEVSAISNEKLNILHVLVIGPTGIVDNLILSEQQSANNIAFSLNVTEHMIPKSNIFMYYIREDGTVVHDYLQMSIGFSLKNELKVSAPSTADAKQQIQIKINTEENSMVFLTATDNIREYENQILLNSLPKNFIFSNEANQPERGELGVFGVFMIDPFKLISCESFPDSTFPSDIEKLSSNIEIAASNFFSNIWFDEDFTISNQEQIIHKKTLDMPGTWEIQGISMHPTKGLSFTKVNPIVMVSKNTSITVQGPLSVNVSETFNVDFTIVNMLENGREIEVEISVDNGEILSYLSEKIGGKQNLKKVMDLRIANFISSTLTVKARKKGFLNFKVQVVGENYDTSISVEVVKIIKPCEKTFENHFANFDIKKVLFIATTDNEEKKDIFLLNNETSKDNTIKVDFKNLLEPGLNELEKIFKINFDYDEFKVDKVAASIIACRYYKFAEDEQNLKFASKRLAKNIKELDKIVFEQGNSKLRLLSYIVEVLADAKEFIIDINQNFFDKFEDLINKTKNQSYFTYDDDLNYMRAMGNLKNQNFLNTARIITGIISFPTTNQNSNKELHTKEIIDLLQDEMKKGKMYDYEKSFMAYNYALNGNLNEANNLVTNISCNFLAANLDKHKSMFIEIASKYILTKILLNQDPQNEVKWLLSQRKPDGRFYSPHDTVLALQALLKFTIYAKTTGLVLRDEGINTGKDDKKRCNYIPDSELSNLDEHNNELVQKSSYTFSYSMHYKVSKLVNSSKFFETTIVSNVLNETTIKIDLKFKLIGDITNLVIAEVRLPTAYMLTKVTGESNSKYQDIDGLVILYIKKMDKNNLNLLKFVIEAKKLDDMISCGEPYVKIYDYYQPNIYGIKYYNDISSNYDYSK